MDKKIFYDAIRGKINLTEQNVMGMDRVLDYLENRRMPLNRAAYTLATFYWETGATMHPIREAPQMSESWRKAHFRYWPYYGRGHVQLTWKDNYARMSKDPDFIKETGGADLVNNPDLMLDWKYALPASVIGMEKGIYTGKALNDYIDTVDESDTEDAREYNNARRIVNGTDKAQKITDMALTFERGLKKSGWLQAAPPKPAVTPDVAAGVGTVVVATPAVAASTGIDWWLAALIAVTIGIVVCVIVRNWRD